MFNIESRMDTFEERTENIMVRNVKDMKEEIIDSIKGEVNQFNW